ncbi:hypothetical protein ACTHGU_19460 [Chitinophagaceae bacterium MMS25-I14]
MTPDFDKELRDKISNAPVKDLMNDFDTAETWNCIRERMQTPEKKKPAGINIWATHLAACLAGMAVTWLIFFYHPAADNRTTGVVIVKKDTVWKTVARATSQTLQPVTSQGTHTSYVIKTIQADKKTPAPVTPIQIPDKRSDESPADNATGTSYAVQSGTNISVQREVTVHLMDINNEDRDLAKREQARIPGAPILTINKPGSINNNTPLAVTGLIQTFKPNK